MSRAWKPTPDTLAAYLGSEEVNMMLAANAGVAPAAAQNEIRGNCFRLGFIPQKVFELGARALVDVATLGISELMIHAAKRGKAAASGVNMKGVDEFVVGPTEAALLIVDGELAQVVNAERVRTMGFWDRMKAILSKGPHIEVAMVDLAPFNVSVPFKMPCANGDTLDCVLDADLHITVESAPAILNLLSRGREAISKAGLDYELVDDEGVTAAGINQAANQVVSSFTTAHNLAQRLARRIAARHARLLGAQVDAANLSADPAAVDKLEAALHSIAENELRPLGISVGRVSLLCGATPEQRLQAQSRAKELEARYKSLEGESLLLDKKRTAELERARKEIDRDLLVVGLLNQQEVERVERQGRQERTAAERAEDLKVLQHDILKGRERHAAELERNLASAKNSVEVERIKMQIERERLAIAKLAQEQNVANLRMIKEIEREDAIARENARFKNVASVTAEQALVASVTKSEDASAALAAKYKSDAASKAGDDKLALMQQMNAQQADLMKAALSANAQVAHGLVGATRPAPQAEAFACPTCGESLKKTFKLCPFCGGALGKA